MNLDITIYTYLSVDDYTCTSRDRKEIALEVDSADGHWFAVIASNPVEGWCRNVTDEFIVEDESDDEDGYVRDQRDLKLWYQKAVL